MHIFCIHPASSRPFFVVKQMSAFTCINSWGFWRKVSRKTIFLSAYVYLGRGASHLFCLWADLHVFVAALESPRRSCHLQPEALLCWNLLIGSPVRERRWGSMLCVHPHKHLLQNSAWQAGQIICCQTWERKGAWSHEYLYFFLWKGFRERFICNGERRKSFHCRYLEFLIMKEK